MNQQKTIKNLDCPGCDLSDSLILEGKDYICIYCKGEFEKEDTEYWNKVYSQ